MEIRHLRYFVAMAESGSLMKASERLHVAQPALSVHLTNLEHELGVQLMERSNRGIELTEEGKLLYERATLILGHYHEAVAALKGRKKDLRGSVSIGMPSSCSSTLSPEIYRLARERLPNVDVYITDASSAAIYEWLEAGRLDFALLFSSPESSGLSVTPLYAEEYYLASAPDPEDQSTEIDFDEMLKLPLISSCKSTPWRKVLDDAAAKRGRKLNCPVESDSVSIMRAIVSSGQVHAVLPGSCIKADAENGLLWARKVVNPELRGQLSLCNVSSIQQGDAQRAFRDIIIEAAKSIDGVANAKPRLSNVVPIMQTLPSKLLPPKRSRI